MLKLVSTLISFGLPALIYFVCEQQQINPIWELEYYLFKGQKCQPLAKIVRAVNRSFTPENIKQIELSLIRRANASTNKFHEILQKEIYLLEEKDTLEKKRSHTGLG